MQDQIFKNGEGDAWFNRNRETLALEEKNIDNMPIVKILERNGIKLDSIFEAGCSNGWLLNGLKKKFDMKGNCAGLDPSEKAIADGKEKFKDLDLFVSLLHETWPRETFDLVFARLVFCWIPRNRLLASLSALDELCSKYLIIDDFNPKEPITNFYHHLPEGQAYTFKRDYAGMFLATGMYEKIDEMVYHHSTFEEGGCPEDVRSSCVLLKKKEYV